MMKRFVYLMTALLLVCANIACADNERTITVAELPADARLLLEQHFADRKIVLAKVETDVLSKSYEVVFADGDRIDFDSKGRWAEIECPATAVPSALVPAAITHYVRNNYPGQTIKSLEKDRKEYEVKLSNRIELIFDKKLRLKKIDR